MKSVRIANAIFDKVFWGMMYLHLVVLCQMCWLVTGHEFPI